MNSAPMCVVTGPALIYYWNLSGSSLTPRQPTGLPCLAGPYNAHCVSCLGLREMPPAVTHEWPIAGMAYFALSVETPMGIYAARNPCCDHRC